MAAGGLAAMQAQPALATAATAIASPQLSATDAVRELYDRSAERYDDLDDGPLAAALGLPALRAALLARASGDVLELCVGAWNRPMVFSTLVQPSSS